MQIAVSYAIAAVLFILMDMLWLGLIAKNFYKDKLGSLMSPDVNWIAAVSFYLLFIAGILYFALYPALKDASWQAALLKGAFLGGLCYATYDLTNMATLKGWPWQIVVVDIVWGVVLTGSISVITYFIVSAIKW
ncbi:DUF2177 family protein [soil metagenome]